MGRMGPMGGEEARNFHESLLMEVREFAVISVGELLTDTGGSPVPPTQRVMEFGRGRSYGG